MKRALLTLALLSVAPAARAEIAVLANGMTLKVTGSHEEGETLFLVLKDGGEVGVPPETVRGFVPDEVVEEMAPASDPGPVDVQALARETARRHGIDPELVLAVIGAESAFRADAVSPKGAQGLMQLMPATAASLGVRDALDPADNLDGGVRHLGWLMDLYRGDLRKVLAAYNAGSGAVSRYGGVPPYRETQQYVDRVLRRYKPGR